KDGFHSLIIGQIRIDGNKFTIPYSNLYKKTHKPITITIPPVLLDKKIKQI
ncbi:transposase, partial [Parageobacillus toebii]